MIGLDAVTPPRTLRLGRELLGHAPSSEAGLELTTPLSRLSDLLLAAELSL